MGGVKIDYNNPIKYDIINRYLSGERSSSISKSYKFSKNTILNFIRNSEANSKILKNKYFVDESFFSHIDCAEKSWMLGWLMSDGCVYNNRLQLSLHTQDEDIINKFLYFLEYGGIKNYSKTQKCVRINIYNKKLSHDLMKLGCVPNKSLILEFPKQIKNEYIRHFIRGYFEGDGCVTMNKKRNYIKINFKGTFQMLNEFKEMLKNSIDINCTLNKSNKYNDKNTYDLNISGNLQSIKFLNWIYHNTCEDIRLNRKFNKSKELYNKMIGQRKKKIKEDFIKLTY